MTTATSSAGRKNGRARTCPDIPQHEKKRGMTETMTSGFYDAAKLWLLQDSHLLAHPPQHLQRLLQLFFCMGGRHNCSDAGFAFGYGGEGDTRTQYALFEQLTGEVHGELAVADDDWQIGR